LLILSLLDHHFQARFYAKQIVFISGFAAWIRFGFYDFDRFWQNGISASFAAATTEKAESHLDAFLGWRNQRQKKFSLVPIQIISWFIELSFVVFT